MTEKSGKHFEGLEKTAKEITNSGIKVYYVYNVLREWDDCVLFLANDDKHAMEYVQDILSGILVYNTRTCTHFEDLRVLCASVKCMREFSLGFLMRRILADERLWFQINLSSCLLLMDFAIYLIWVALVV